MAMTTDSSTSLVAGAAADVKVVAAADVTAVAAVNSTQPRLPSPWAQVVRGGEPEALIVSRSPSSSPFPTVSVPEQAQKHSEESSTSENQSESFDNTDGTIGGLKKSAWNKPLNGVVEPSSVMGGAVAWPALSESTRSSPRSSSDTSKPILDGSITVSQGPITSQSPKKQPNTNANTHSNTNHTPVRQRSMQHRGGSSSSFGNGPVGRSTQAGFSQAPPPPPPPFPVFTLPYGNMVPGVEPPIRGSRPVGGVPSQPHAASDHSSHRNPNRKVNYGGRPRGDGSYHNNHGGRRNQDLRDAQVTPQFGAPPGGFIPPQPPGSGPFLAPVRPFAGPMGFDMAAPFMYVPTLPPESFRGVPIIPPPPPPPLLFPVMDPALPALLVKQIEYYFSDGNLVKDDFLRSKMDGEGWVPIELIANFPRVRQLTNDIQFILVCLRGTTLVEVQENKVRRRDDWNKWIHTAGSIAAESGIRSPRGSTDNVLSTSLQKVSLDDSATEKTSVVDARDVQVEVAVSGVVEGLTCQSKPAQEEDNAGETCSSQA